MQYQRTGYMKATGERLNRTIREPFADFHESLLFTDREGFNEKLADWSVPYNVIRPHKGPGLQTLVQYIINHNQKCSLWWTHTRS